jgi:hypothetical protein
MILAQEDSMSREMDYELSRYDAYSNYAQLFVNRGIKEARIFESLADLCFDKAQLLKKVDQMLQEWAGRDPSPKKGPASTS